MKFGICISDLKDEARLKAIAEAGFTYVEPGLCNLAAATEAEVSAYGELLNRYGLSCYCTNVMFPGEIKLVGKTVDSEKIKKYLHDVLQKTKMLGTKLHVLGSGGARTLPQGENIEEAYLQFADIVRNTIAPIFEQYGRTIVIEPLRYAECNIVNTVQQAMQIVESVAKPNVQLLIDYFHAGMNSEDMSTYPIYKNALKHVHIASPSNERKFPKPTDTDDYKAFFTLLRSMQYDLAMSIEGSGGETIEDFKESLTASFALLTAL